jgi:hypothetical protein
MIWTPGSLKVMTSQNEMETVGKIEMLRSIPLFADCSDEQVHIGCVGGTKGLIFSYVVVGCMVVLNPHRPSWWNKGTHL